MLSMLSSAQYCFKTLALHCSGALMLNCSLVSVARSFSSRLASLDDGAHDAASETVAGHGVLQCCFVVCVLVLLVVGACATPAVPYPFSQTALRTKAAPR